MSIQGFITYFLLLIIAWVLLHYLLIWMEKKGWVYYRQKSRGSGAGNALQELNGLLSSTPKSVMERPYEQQEEDKADDDGNRTH